MVHRRFLELGGADGKIVQKKSPFFSHFFVFQYFALGPIANETSMGLATPSAQDLDLTPSELRDRCLRS